MKKAVVTGMGALSPLGNTLRATWEGVRAGAAGIAALSRFDSRDVRSPWAGELKGFRAEDYLPHKDALRYDAFIHYAWAAASMALEDASVKGALPKSTAVVIGSSRGGIGMVEASVRSRPSAYTMMGSTVGMAASYIAMRLKLRGYALGISNACASGANAVGEAVRLVRSGAAEAVLAGGSEAPLTPLSFQGYGSMGALSKTGLLRPFDAARDGFLLAEGAAVLLIEDMDRAIKRGARIYGEIAGYGNSVDAYHPSAPDPEGQARTIRIALKDAGVAPGEIGHISAHATATTIGDRSEAEAIADVFGPRPRIPISAPKALTGHMLGASGALEAALVLMGMDDSFIPPNPYTHNPEFDLDILPTPREIAHTVALSNSFGFGGLNTALVIRALARA